MLPQCQIGMAVFVSWGTRIRTYVQGLRKASTWLPSVAAPRLLYRLTQNFDWTIFVSTLVSIRAGARRPLHDGTFLATKP